MTVGYAGSRSHHILVDGMNLNVSSPTHASRLFRPGDPGGTLPNPVFDPNYHLGCGIPAAPFGPFTTIANINDRGDARYDSLQVKAETKSMRHGLYVLLGYTYARNFDTGFTDGLGSSTGVTYFPLPGTTRADWSLSQIQLNHNFTASVLYDLPFGKGKRFGSSWNGGLNAVLGNWQINVIEKITSGFPVFIIASNNSSGVNLTNNGNNFEPPRPDLQSQGRQPNLKQVVQHPVLCRPAVRGTRKCSPNSALRT